MAAALWAGDGALVSHGTAGVLWGIEGVASAKVELWVPATRRARHEIVVVHRGTRLDRADRTMLGPIPITTPVRTLIDLVGAARGRSAARRDGETLIRRGLVDARAARARGSTRCGRPGRPGAGRLAALLDARGDGRRARVGARGDGVAADLRGRGCRCRSASTGSRSPGGRYRLDFAWPERKVGARVRRLGAPR